MGYFETAFILPYCLIIGLLCSALCVVLVFSAPRFPRLAGKADHTCAVQSMHVRPTARVGGLAIFIALGVSTLFAPSTISADYVCFILATIIVFLAGLFEDLGFGVSPTQRLIATGISGILMVLFLGAWIPRLGLPGIDNLMLHWAVSVPVTLLITSGVTNGFNMIDGVNGLSSFTAIGAALGLAFISFQSGYTEMVPLTLFLASVVLGFFVLNYPFGLIFLGDGGAYTLGFILSWFGVFILINAPDVSPWAVLLTMFWPVADMVLSIYRRSRSKAATMTPDRLHVHQMVMRALEIHFLGRGRRQLANPLTTLVLAPFIMAPIVVGVMLWDQSKYALIAFVVFSVLFFGSYSLTLPILRKLKRRVQWVVAHS
ncbi:MraY family glycosyltransferase [Sulfitobacter sp. M22]|uniref:MraY family glycosyltransferase n=1 Tax=Sulfitobacter sp. M22 TaxID=2675332 RepID=UPI001F2A499A|nr:glycosyltransferase [Sulfitobacter sp. M22]MCF7728090.1 hypothetical protein [Sulfitobacter sp. M22]